MYTGIIEAMGAIVAKQKQGRGYFFSLQAPAFVRRAALGSSISLSGVCLTLAKKKNKELVFEVMPETVSKTNLGQKNIGERVNLETALTGSKEIGGHFVFGHVDAVARVTQVKAKGETYLVTITPPRKLMKYIVAQGSVALDGVSLTVARVGEDNFTAALIAYTREHTTLGSLQAGDTVNLECDMLAKYVEKIHGAKRKGKSQT